MKKAARIFLIIGMVLTFYLVFPVVFGIIAIRKLDYGATKEELTLWGVLSVFFVSTLGGMLMLLMDPKEVGTYESSTNENWTLDVRMHAITSRLLDLKKLYDEGIIDKGMYDLKRSAIAKEL